MVVSGVTLLRMTLHLPQRTLRITTTPRIPVTSRSPPRQLPLQPERQAVALVSRHYALDVAFREHRRGLEYGGRPVRLPGLRHETSDQTFFLAFAQVCRQASALPEERDTERELTPA